MRSLFLFAGIVACAACSRGTDSLRPGQNLPGDAGARDASESSDASEPSDARPLCESFEASNLREIRRLGLLTSDAIVEGRMSEMFEQRAGELAATLSIDRVVLGSSFMAGAEVTVHFENEDQGRFPPGEYIFGFSGNEYPVRDDFGGASWWSTQVIVPVAERADVEDLVRYRAAPYIAMVSLESRDEDRAHFRVVEALRGELPERFSMNWSTRAFAVDFPQPNDAAWFISLSRLDLVPGDVYLGTGHDFRPATDVNRALIETAIVTLEESIDTEALRAFGERYRTSWRLRRSPHVLTAHPTGFVEECCTGAGGTYVEYRIDDELQGRALERRLVGGGHGSMSSESCGGPAHIFGVESMDGVVVPSRDQFSCGRDTFTDATSGSHFIRVDLPNTPENLTDAVEWLVSRPPYYLFGAEERQNPERGGVWSAPLSVDRALAAGELTLFRVVSAESRQIVLETTFYAEMYEHLEKYQATLSLECGDPRLFALGRYYYGLVTWDDLNYRGRPGDDVLGGGPFLVPGVLLPYESWVERTAMTLESLR